MTKAPAKATKAKLPRGRRNAPPRATSDELSQATTEDMQREDLGIASKE